MLKRFLFFLEDGGGFAVWRFQVEGQFFSFGNVAQFLAGMFVISVPSTRHFSVDGRRMHRGGFLGYCGNGSLLYPKGQANKRGCVLLLDKSENDQEEDCLRSHQDQLEHLLCLR